MNTSETFPDLAPNQQVRFWVDRLDGQAIRQYRFSAESATPEAIPNAAQVETDEHGWPTSARWPGMQQPLFSAGTGDFQSVAVPGFGGRWVALDTFNTGDITQRDQLRREHLQVIDATAGEPAEVAENAFTTVYTQKLEHPRLRWLTRRLEVWHGQARAKLTVQFHRLEGELPEVFFVQSTVPCPQVMPSASCGGLPFTPYRDQLPGTCGDYFTIDHWLDYRTPAGQWVWVTRDAPLVAFGDHQVLARRADPPANMDRVMTMVFNNIWFTNFVADSHGALEFEFDFVWNSPEAVTDKLDAVAETLVAEPTIVFNPQLREHPIFMERLHR